MPNVNKVNTEVVVYEHEMGKNLDYFEIDKEDCYKDQEYSGNGILYNDISAKEAILEKTCYKCPISHCKENVFDQLSNLTFHVKKQHKRYYCEICLKDGKRFLSDTTIFTYDDLQEHNQYGEYDENLVVLAPIHPECRFCKIRFFNEEIFISHMTAQHFECQLCKPVYKNLCFHKDIRSLHLHNKYKHVQCPFGECLNDFFVVFENRKKAIDHMVTKHKCSSQVAEDRLNKYSSDNSDPFEPYKKITNYREDPLDVESLVKGLKETMSEYIKHKKEMKQNNVINQQINKYSNKEPTYNTKKGKKGGKWNNNNYDYSNDFNKQSSITNDQYKNSQNKDYKVVVKEIHTDGSSVMWNNNNYDYSNDFNKQSSNTNDQYNKNSQNKDYKVVVKEIHTDGSSVMFDGNLSNNNTKTMNSYSQVKPPERPILKIDDYSIFFNDYFKTTRQFIINKIKSEEIPQKEVCVPKEIGYQMTVIIDRNDNKENAELKMITNFGFGFSLVEEILHCFCLTKGYSYEDSLSRLPFRKLLVLYKWLHICSLKITGGFYRRDHDEVEEDIYDDFFPSEKKNKEPKQVKSAITYSVNKPKETCFGISKKGKKKPKIINPDLMKSSSDNAYLSNKFKSELHIDENQELIKAENESLNQIENQANAKEGAQGKSKLNNMFNPEAEEESNFNDMNKKNIDDFAPKSKLGSLLNGKPIPKKEVIKPGKKRIVYEDDFPELI
eukprot:CAMPEP_0170536730 /NCGR_PEP_ID=MMETSP0209-20121228/102312_1 /TAXON_ID=665100 ORGANISM="Litonotus pictus, Strain P1" /NCGR_SAMPLE_ID=MMETSP0209 /ASSEMBLY_ACC=CAM_ASM_000301 /LENGTH=721 /DNA_ID=CAMNT_0010838125 /DNA_START=105 /DNA_END=2271 /DNA_ORIENTATION=+